MKNDDCIDCEHFHDLDVYDVNGNLLKAGIYHIMMKKSVDGQAVYYWPVYSPCCEYCPKLMTRMKDIEK